MRLLSQRTLIEMKSILSDPTAPGPDPVYQVFTDLGNHLWINKTIIASGKVGKEYPKTFGHYHGERIDERCYVASGEGVLVSQKRDLSEVLLIRAKLRDELVTKPGYGHSWSNTGKEELVLFDNWSVPHTPADYEEIEKMHGMAYYLVEEDGEIKALPNPNYQNLPSPVWLTADEFNNRWLKT